MFINVLFVINSQFGSYPTPLYLCFSIIDIVISVIITDGDCHFHPADHHRPLQALPQDVLQSYELFHQRHLSDPIAVLCSSSAFTVELCITILLMFTTLVICISAYII